jgi:O-antigen ligase
MTFASLALSFFVAALVAPIALSIWLRPEVSLGGPYWILTLVLVTPVLLVPLLYVAQDPAPVTAPLALLGLSLMLLLFGSIAAGWLMGTAVVLLVRAVRARVGATQKS